MSASASSPGPRYTALLRLLRASETIWNGSRLLFARWDLGPSQFNVLNLLREQPEGLTQSDLSRALIMHRSNATGLVDRLERRGLVRRRDSRLDRRTWHVVLTPAGQKLIAEILPHYHRAAEAVWGDLPARRAHEVAETLAAVTANAEAIQKKLGDPTR